MKKDIISKILIVISIILVITFAVTLYKDYINRHKLVTVDFSAAILVRTIEFLVPSVICIIISIALKVFKKGKMKKQKYKILLIIGVIPFIINFIISLTAIKNGFQLFDLLPEYGLKAFIHQFVINTVFYFPIFIIGLILIIFSIYKIRKVEKNEK